MFGAFERTDGVYRYRLSGGVNKLSLNGNKEFYRTRTVLLLYLYFTIVMLSFNRKD